MIEAPSMDALAGSEFHKFVCLYTGHLREYHNHRAYQDCFEYGAPLCVVDEIMSHKATRSVSIDRDALVCWHAHAVRI